MKVLASIGLVAALGAGGALAQSSSSQGTNVAPLNDPNAPYDITSESQEDFRLQRLIILHGNVEVIQNQDRLRSPEVKIYYKDRQGGPKSPPPPGAQAGYGNQIDHIEAAGPVYYVTPTESAKGDHGYYDGNTQLLTLTGNVILTQGKDVSTGDKLVSNRRTGQSVLSSNDPSVPSRRVRAVLYPSQANQPAAKPAGTKPSGAASTARTP